MLDRDANLPSRTEPGHYVWVPEGNADAWGGGYQKPSDHDDEGLDPLRFFMYLVKYRWLIATFVVIALILGVVTTWMQTPKYQATARIEVMTQGAQVLDDMDVVAQVNDSRAYETARQRIISRDLARRVVFDLNLAQNAKFMFPLPDFAISNLWARILGLSPQTSIEGYSAEQRENIAVGRVLEGLSVDLLNGTSLIAVRFASPDPILAQNVANQVVRSYMDQQVDRTVETSDLARQFIEEQVSELKVVLEQSERELVNYAQENGLSAAGGEDSLIATSIQAVNEALSEAVRERLEQERLLGQINTGNAANLQQVRENETVAQLRSSIATLEGTYQQQSTVYQPDYPDMVQLRSQIDGLRQQLGLEIDAISNSIRVSQENALQAEVDLKNELQRLETEQVKFQTTNIEYTILNREVESNRAQYQALIDKLNSLGVVSDLRRTNIDVVDLAVVPNSPFSPSLSRNLLLALACAIGLALAIIYLVELLNNKFDSPDQIEKELKLPVLGMLPKPPKSDLLTALTDPQSSLSEAYRSLRTNLQFIGGDGAESTLLVTSAEPSEGKSTTAQQLAVQFASLGKTVLLIDADLRRPSLHRAFKVSNSVGLADLLTGSLDAANIKQAFHTTEVEGVTLMTAGTPMINPANLLTSQQMIKVLRACEEKYDKVIIDAPPVIGLSDSLILSRLAAATVLVVAAHQVPRKAAVAALKRLTVAGGTIVGAAFTKLDVQRFEYNYAYSYMTTDYYGYGNERLAKLPGSSEKSAENVNSWSSGFNAAQNFARRFSFARMRSLLENRRRQPRNL